MVNYIFHIYNALKNLNDSSNNETNADEEDIVAEPELQFGQAALCVDGRACRVHHLLLKTYLRCQEQRQSTHFQANSVPAIEVLENSLAAVHAARKWHPTCFWTLHLKGRNSHE